MTTMSIRDVRLFVEVVGRDDERTAEVMKAVGDFIPAVVGVPRDVAVAAAVA